MSARAEFLSGVVEGFYGKPWSQAERFELFEWMANWGLDTYLYACKDDLKHRALWRELYSTEESSHMRELVDRSAARGLRFIYALAPGLDIHFSKASETETIFARFEQMLSLGCKHFALLFDDIPPSMDETDRKQFGSFASAQAHVTNTVFRWVRQRSPQACFLFCPTAYCGRMVQRELGGADYLGTIGRELLPQIDVLWTGSEIISRTIEPDHIPEMLLRRKPIIWDNLHANDYDRSRFYCGPYSGRPPEIVPKLNGILSNPNNEFCLNFVPLRTLAAFVNAKGDWNPLAAYLSALAEWEPKWKTIGEAISFEHLKLFGDCYYLPHEDGPDATELYENARQLITGRHAELLPAFRTAVARLKEVCHRVTELQDRSLFYALSQRIWDLREELDLLERYVESRYAPEGSNKPFHSDFHLPQTYRGSFVRRLQGLLIQNSDGSFASSISR